MRERKINIIRDPVDVVFRHIPPEALIDYLLSDNKNAETVNVNHIDRKVFDRSAQSLLSDMTPDEVELVWELTKDRMHDRIGKDEKPLVFYLLSNLAKECLVLNQDYLMYEIVYALQWRDISIRLGQDLFTTAYLASEDARSGYQRTFFSWPQILRSNDARIHRLTQKGVAENHFHLEGSVPAFPLVWVSLMNHPEDAFQIDNPGTWLGKQFRHNLTPSHSFGSTDQEIPWSQRLCIAAWLRAKIFLELEKPESGSGHKGMTGQFAKFVKDLGKEGHYINLFHEIKGIRRDYGKKELTYNRQMWCLDYANTLEDSQNNLLNNLLVGERYLLYRCIRACFLGVFPNEIQNLFYLYLLIKSRFRSELVQVNNRPGFQNFGYYQNRKSFFWNRYPEYREYAYRMAINQTILENNLCSLEVRITPSTSPDELIHYIYDVDRAWLETREWLSESDLYTNRSALEIWNNPLIGGTSTFSGTCKRTSPMTRHEIRRKMEQISRESESGGGSVPVFYYVLHFIKEPMKPIKEGSFSGEILPVRHYSLRQKTRVTALSIVKALEKEPYLCTRIRGIDAANTELGCRPENFATEFRFLSQILIRKQTNNWFWEKNSPRPFLSMTYHVGEDFYSIEDGLRAVDEAIIFLNLRRGSRIGHGLALGVDPEQHYRWKGYYVAEKKQDRLDNLIWLLFRSSEWGITLSSDLQSRMKHQAENLMNYIFESARSESCHLSLEEYFESWRLRGHHPEIIKEWIDSKKNGYPEFIVSYVMRQYLESRENLFFQQEGTGKQPYVSENQKKIAYYYLYSKEVRERGQEIEVSKVEKPYLNLLRRMQDKLLWIIHEQGISIECNPSSNILIGSMERYDNHPIFRFNHHGLPDIQSSSRCQLSVSLNTDDQGVFDTSLENEYSLLASAMYMKVDSEGKRVYDDQMVLEYLENLQEMGKRQIFPKQK